jgi:hypothetical protein
VLAVAFSAGFLALPAETSLLEVCAGEVFLALSGITHSFFDSS